MQNEGRNHAIDSLRVLVVIMVIGIHSAGQYVLDNPVFDANYWVAATVEAFVQIGVPLFVMISGAFILGKIDSWQRHYQQRLKRLLLPLLIWLPSYWLWMWIKGDDVVGYLHGFWQGRSFLHLWYLVMLLGLYILAPLLSEGIRRIRQRYPQHQERYLWLLTLLLFTVGALARLYDEYFDYQRFFPYLALDFMGYFLAGYLLLSYPIRKVTPSIILYLLGTAFTLVASYFAKLSGGSYYFYNNLAPGIIVASISLFALVSSQRYRSLPANSLSRLQDDVMGIYLVHIAILNIITKGLSMWMPYVMEVAWLSLVLRIPLVFICSLALVRLLKRFRFGKHLF